MKVFIFSKFNCSFLLFCLIFCPLLPQKSILGQEMGLVVQRCRYYYIRARAGDHTPRYLLQNQDPNQGKMTGYEKCVNAINVYLENPNISSEERQIYEDLKDIFIDTMEKLPKKK